MPACVYTIPLHNADQLSIEMIDLLTSDDLLG